MMLAMVEELLRLASELRSIGRFAGGRCILRYTVQIIRLTPTVLRDRSLHAVDDALGTGPFRVQALGKSLSIKGASFGLLREIYGRRSYFRPGFGVRPGETVVDLGAHVGTFSVLAACLGARVVAVELDPDRAAELEANLRRNRADAAVVRGRIRGHPPLDMETLVARHRLERIDFLKIDVEGDEYELFDGRPAWLDRVRRISMEVHPAAGNPAGLAETLSSRGFSVELLETGYLFARRTG
jgi:hypothetical protein